MKRTLGPGSASARRAIGKRLRICLEPEGDDLDRSVADAVLLAVAGQVERRDDRVAAVDEEVVLAERGPERRVRHGVVERVEDVAVEQGRQATR